MLGLVLYFHAVRETFFFSSFFFSSSFLICIHCLKPVEDEHFYICHCFYQYPFESSCVNIFVNLVFSVAVLFLHVQAVSPGEHELKV